MYEELNAEMKQKKGKISWYRVPVDREDLKSLYQRSDLRGMVQVLGHLGLVLLTGAAVRGQAGDALFSAGYDLNGDDVIDLDDILEAIADWR